VVSENKNYLFLLFLLPTKKLVSSINEQSPTTQTSKYKLQEMKCEINFKHISKRNNNHTSFNKDMPKIKRNQAS